MGTVSGPFLVIRNLSVVFDDDTFPPPPREEDLLDAMLFLNRADSPLDKAARAVFEDIEAAEDDAVLNMTICFSLSVYFSLILLKSQKEIIFSSSSSSFSLSCELYRTFFLSLSLSLLSFRSFLPICSRVAFCKARLVKNVLSLSQKFFKKILGNVLLV